MTVTYERFLVFDQSYDFHRILVVVDVRQRWELGVVTLLGHGVMDRQEALEGGERGERRQEKGYHHSDQQQKALNLT